MYEEASAKIIMIMATLAIVTVPSSLLQVSHAQSNQDLANKILEVHNSERAAVRVASLTWSDRIAATAQTWAQQIATTGIMKHDDVHSGPTCTGTCYGESLAGFFNDVSAPKGGQSLWVAEKSSYDGGPCGDPPVYRPSSCGSASGHYTQMVWQNSREVGCGTAGPIAGQSYSILVCRYSPPGNYPGQMPYGQGAAQAVGEEDASFPPADQAVGEEDASFPPADQGAAAPPDADGGDGGGGDGGGDGN